MVAHNFSWVAARAGIRIDHLLVAASKPSDWVAYLGYPSFGDPRGNDLAVEAFLVASKWLMDCRLIA